MVFRALFYVCAVQSLGGKCGKNSGTCKLLAENTYIKEARPGTLA